MCDLSAPVKITLTSVRNELDLVESRPAQTGPTHCLRQWGITPTHPKRGGGMPFDTISEHDDEGDQHTTHDAAGEEFLHEGSHE
jgi:hypothetical protein